MNRLRTTSNANVQPDSEYAGMVLGDIDQAESHKDNGDFT